MRSTFASLLAFASALALALALARTPALAAPAPASQASEPAKSPWSVGVTPAQRARAKATFAAGNRLFSEARYAEALKLYRKAVALWDHPSIRYNMTVCLVHLERFVEAYENLALALRHGKAPLGAEVHERATTYRVLLQGRLAWLRVRARQRGVKVTLDGSLMFVGPGQRTLLLEPGEHQLVGSAPKMLTYSERLLLLPKRTRVVTLELEPPGEGKLVRRWPRWLPWTMLASGAAIALVGLPLVLSAISDRDTFDNELEAQCPNGCPLDTLPEPVRDLESAAKLKSGFAVGFFVAGGAVVAAGLTMLLLNQPRRVEPKVSVSAHVGVGAASVAARWSF